MVPASTEMLQACHRELNGVPKLLQKQLPIHRHMSEWTLYKGKALRTESPHKKLTKSYLLKSHKNSYQGFGESIKTVAILFPRQQSRCRVVQLLTPGLGAEKNWRYKGVSGVARKPWTSTSLGLKTQFPSLVHFPYVYTFLLWFQVPREKSLSL